MNKRMSGSVVFSIIVILSFQPRAVGFRSGSLVQEPLKTYKVVSHQTHERVLDILFQRDEANRDYDFILRFLPSFAPESQILVKRRVGKVEVVEYTSLSGNIYDKLNNTMSNGGREDAAEMAKLVQVRKRVIEVPTAQVRKWRESLANSVGATMKTLEQRDIEGERGKETITIDGTFYYFWYTQVTGDISFNLLDYEVNNRKAEGELALVRWMNAVRLDVQKLKSLDSPK